MKYLMILILAAGTAFPLQAQDRREGIVFTEDERWESVLQKAKQEDRLVFVDVYTSWCGPCKMMSSEIFPQKEAGDFFNANFINFKTDAEKSEDGRHIARTYNVTAYPTFLFVNGDGEPVYRFLGARSLEELIKEGAKAVAAKQAYHELEGYEKRYRDGERDMDFLVDYAGVMVSSGLDASSPLVDYLAQVNDNDLLSPANLPRIESVTIYDPQLAERLIARLECRYADPAKDEKAFSKANSSVGKYFSGAIRHLAREGTEEDFERFLELKRRFLALGNRDSVSIAMLGGGVFYLPAQMLQLDYYNNKKDGARFMEVFERYMVDVRESFDQINEALKALEDNTDARVEEALANGDEAEAKKLRNSFGLMKTLGGMDNIYISTALLEYIDSYDEYYGGEKDDAYRDKLAGWYVYLSGVSPSVKTAVYAADKLVALDRPGDAAAVLETGLDKGRDASEVTPELISSAEEKLARLK